MKVRDDPPVHLTYCLNVHPGESWAENFAAIRDKALEVRRLVAPREQFGLGLRLSARAARELAAGDELDRLGDFLRANGLYAFTINGFPFGAFHGRAVKQDVYAPDWRTVERRDYTILLADILARLLPEGVSGSISTVPGSYGAWIGTEDDVRQMACMLADAAAGLHALADRSGKHVAIALEAEPDCFIETTGQAVAFLTGDGVRFGVERLVGRHGLSAQQAEGVWRRHVGVCLDTAHAAVEFEDPAWALRQFQAAGVPVAKVQLSSALAVQPTEAALKDLEAFCEEVYLHQVKARLGGGEIVSYPDLPEALRAAQCGQARSHEQWRVHFHVPVFFAGRGELRSTSDLLTGSFAGLLRGGACEHLEIETYTFDVLPEALRSAALTQSIAREYEWVMRNVLGRQG